MGKAELRIEIDELLLQQAEAAGVDVARIAERALKAALGEDAAQQRADAWAAENEAEIKAHRELIDREGVFGEDFRTW